MSLCRITVCKANLMSLCTLCFSISLQHSTCTLIPTFSGRTQHSLWSSARVRYLIEQSQAPLLVHGCIPHAFWATVQLYTYKLYRECDNEVTQCNMIVVVKYWLMLIQLILDFFFSPLLYPAVVCSTEFRKKQLNGGQPKAHYRHWMCLVLCVVVSVEQYTYNPHYNTIISSELSQKFYV